MDRITLIVNDMTGRAYDIEVPLSITARELIEGLHTGLARSGPCPKAIRAENPVAFLTGERVLDAYGLRDGSVLFFYEDSSLEEGGDQMPDALTSGEILPFDRAIECNTDGIRLGGRGCQITLKGDAALGPMLEINRIGQRHTVTALAEDPGVYYNLSHLARGKSVLMNEGDFLFAGEVSFAYKGGRLLTHHTTPVTDLPYMDTAEQNSHLIYPIMNRTSRFHDVVSKESIDIQDPPAAMETNQNPLLLSILPAAAMIVLTIVVRGGMSGGGMVLFSVCSMAIGVIGSVITYLQTSKQSKQKEQERDATYRAYIDTKEEEIRILREKERETLERIYISPEEELRHVEEFTAELFDRTRADEDFLDLRLGVGRMESHQKIRCKDHAVFEQTDSLFELPHQLEDHWKYSEGLPVVVKGTQANAIGIQGTFADMGRMMNQLILDIASRQYPSDAAIYCLCADAFEEQMYAARMLPHLQSLTLGRRNLVHDNESRDLMLEKLFKELTLREEDKDYAAAARWLVLFVYADSDLVRHPLMQYIDRASEYHVLFIFLAQHREQLPIGCSYITILFSNVRQGLLVNLYDREADCLFSYRGVEDAQLEAVSRKLAPVYTGETNLSSRLVDNLSFYDMPGIDGRTSPEEICKRWAQADPRKSLAAPLGVDAAFRPVCLDLTETAHGPHGLVAGTTGSGKSELLISYILSMAYYYSPEVVNFVIIDFKGGGTASQFAALPHLTGTITNLSDSEMKRSLISIRAEHRRRQRLFNEAGVSNINQYTTEYRAGRAKEPLPHLFIIADEFAELKAQQPDFMDELISTARIGRSLGIHLILATQKPAGVVNDQIWSNSDFKLCLRVQTREDSNEVLHSPLAAEIREPGRAYLQVGRQDLLLLFQSGYSGVAADGEEASARAFRLDVRSLSGRRSLLFEKKKQKAEGARRTKTQFDQILAGIVEANAQWGCAPPRMLCLPALGDTLPFKDEAGGYSLALGIYDQPSCQIQSPLIYEPTSGNLLVVGASQMGKTNLLQTLVRSAAEHLDSTQINLYLVDFNTGVLRSFKDLSIVGGVVMQDQEERFKNLIKLLRQEIAARKNEMAEKNVTSFKNYLEEGLGDRPLVVVLLDNYAAYRELYDEDYGSDITYLLREGPAAGISFVVTATRGNLLGARNLSSFSERILLHIADVNHMSEVIESCRQKIPETAGRGLMMIGKELLELQIFQAFGEHESIEEFVGDRAFGRKARAIPEVPAKLTQNLMDEMFGFCADPYLYAYGMDYTTVEPMTLRLDQQFQLTLVGKNEEGKGMFLRALLDHLIRHQMQAPVRIRVIDNFDRDLEAFAGQTEYFTDHTLIKDFMQQLHQTAQERAQLLREVGRSALKDVPLEVLIVNTKEAVGTLSDDNAAMRQFEELKDQYKLMKILLIFGNLENKTVSYSSPALLRQLRDLGQAIQFENLATGRMFDIDSLTVRENKFVLAKDDAFRIDDGMIAHIKIAVQG